MGRGGVDGEGASEEQDAWPEGPWGTLTGSLLFWGVVWRGRSRGSSLGALDAVGGWFKGL